MSKIDGSGLHPRLAGELAANIRDGISDEPIYPVDETVARIYPKVPLWEVVDFDDSEHPFGKKIYLTPAQFNEWSEARDARVRL